MLKIVGVSILSFYPDWMHCKSLSIDKNLLGSTLYVLVHYVLTGTVEKTLRRSGWTLKAAIRNWALKIDMAE